MATVSALVVGLVATGYFMLAAQAERDRAEGEASKATAINNFLQETLGSANPYEGTGREVTVLEALDGAVETIDAAFADQPEIRAAVEHTIGCTYRDLGEYDRAEPLLRSALETRQRLVTGPQADVATSLNALGELLYYQGDPDAAAALWQEALEIRHALFDKLHPDVAELLNSLGVAHQTRGDYAAATGMYREALAMRRTLFGDEHEEVANTLNNLAIVRGLQGDYATAAPMLREALAIRRIVLGDDHPDTSSSLNNLAFVLTRLGDYAAAEPLVREALEKSRESLGEQHPRVAAHLGVLAELYEAWDKPGQAAEYRALLRERDRED